jgi:hypothetical protein
MKPDKPLDAESSPVEHADLHSDRPNTLELLKEATALLEAEDREYDLREFLKTKPLYLVHDYETKGARPIGTYGCGSVKMENTPASLYRALFLFAPERVSFKDMYKNSFLTLVSADYSLVASIEFFKYELAIYFSATREHISGTRGSSIIAGAPGSDNGIWYQGAAAEAWFGLLTKLLQRKWMVYGGNDFEV